MKKHMKEYRIRDLDFIENSASCGNVALWCAREIELRSGVLNLRIRICKKVDSKYRKRKDYTIKIIT